MAYHIIQPKFPFGNLLVSDAVLSRGFAYIPLLNRHLSGDWGDISEYDCICNNEAVKDGAEVLSQYAASDSTQKKDLIIIVTAADRSHTVVFLTTEDPS